MRRILTILAVLAFLVLLFLPKEQVVGGLRGGPIGPNERAYAEKFRCLGASQNFCPPWPDYGCSVFCYGALYGRQCFLETAPPPAFREEDTTCRPDTPSKLTLRPLEELLRFYIGDAL